MTKAAILLKELRNQAGLSRAYMAEEMGYSNPSSYQHWEDRYKNDYLPPKIYKNIRKILLNHGMSEEEVSTLDKPKINKSDILKNQVSSDDYLDAEIMMLSTKEALDAMERNPLNISPSEFSKFVNQLYQIAIKDKKYDGKVSFSRGLTDTLMMNFI